MKDNLSNIPDELKALRRWVVWLIEDNDPKKKVPKHAGTGEITGTNMPYTWSNYEVALDMFLNKRPGKYNGVGFMLSESDPYSIIDLDGVRDPKTGHILDWAQVIIDQMDSYTEVSHGKEGIHIAVRGEKPPGRCRRDQVEIYDRRRYIAFTGDVLDGRNIIEDRQEALDQLCEETFGESAVQAAPVAVDDLVLDPDANPPEDKLDALLEDDDFRMLWEHRKRLPSLSDYDWHLACHAIEAGWGDQEVADLLIAFRRKHGKADDFAKALRKDYIPNTIAKARAETKGAGVLGLLPFKVAKVLQYGEQDSEIFLVLDNGKEIGMGATDRYVSPRLAQARLIESKLGLPSRALKRWNEIILALQPLMEIVHSTTREEDASSWLDDYVSSRTHLPRIEKDSDIGEIFGSGLNSMADDKEGCLYLRLSDITRYCRVHSGMPNINTKTVSRDLLRLGFEKRKFRREDGKQFRLWVSKPGFVETLDEDDNDNGDTEGPH